VYSVLRPLLFRLEPEDAHALTLHALRLGGDFPPSRWLLSNLFAAPPTPVRAFGLTFKNPIGLAAGYDKDGRALRGLAALGFGHVEIGTVTPQPQPGNPRPRLFRLDEDQAVINRLGFPSRGGAYVIQNVATFKRSNVVVGINLGKNKDTPLEAALQDYLSLMGRFMALADYLTINISSPNTPGLRSLQGGQMLETLLSGIAAARRNIAQGQAGNAPILVKLAPDLTETELAEAVDVILSTGMDGIIATNTTLARDGLRSNRQGEAGGLSGAPLAVRSEAVLRQVVKRVNGRMPIVSAGGIMSVEDAKRRLDMGASLIQVYTGMIYHGPGLVTRILRSLAERPAAARSSS
jgi:dihydroorotate dehydrogenase